MYIFWFIGLFFIGNFINHITEGMRKEDIEGMATGAAIFFFMTIWIPADVGFWLHEKIFPEYYN
jgi:hypothetical protein